ncbi:MAG: hypothetical protein ACLRTD_22825, partial [Bacteroides sp.]
LITTDYQGINFVFCDPPGIYVMILCDFYRFYMVLLINILRCVVYLLIAHKTLYAQKRGE